MLIIKTSNRETGLQCLQFLLAQAKKKSMKTKWSKGATDATTVKPYLGIGSSSTIKNS